MNLREQYSKETGNSFEKIPINGVHLEYIEWLEKKLKENMVEEMNELLEAIAIEFESRKLYGTKVGGCDWYANEVRKHKR